MQYLHSKHSPKSWMKSGHAKEFFIFRSVLAFSSQSLHGPNCSHPIFHVAQIQKTPSCCPILFVLYKNAFYPGYSDHINPLTPVPPVTARDEPWPFFHFWRHHLWPNLASSILNFCRRKRSFQWCLVHSDWLIGTSNIPKNAQKVEGKTRSQISCHYT